MNICYHIVSTNISFVNIWELLFPCAKITLFGIILYTKRYYTKRWYFYIIGIEISFFGMKIASPNIYDKKCTLVLEYFPNSCYHTMSWRIVIVMSLLNQINSCTLLSWVYLLIYLSLLLFLIHFMFYINYNRFNSLYIIRFKKIKSKPEKRLSSFK